MGHTIDWSGNGWVDKTGGNAINVGSTVLVLTSPTLTSTNGSILLGTSPRLSEQTKVASVTITEPGLYTLSGSAALTITMPLVSQSAGGLFIFRNKSVHAHLLTCSGEANGTKSFCASPLSTASNGPGSQLALPPVLNGSVSLICDGVNFCVAAASGTHTISGA